MTHAAQAALRRTMERESRTTRFCLVCNYVSRIIEPITSRCTKFRFKSLGEAKIMDRLRLICTAEGVVVDEDVYQTIVDVSGGDMRRAITMIQSCYRLKGSSAPITSADILEISGYIPHMNLDRFLDVCRQGEYVELEKYVADLTYEAYSIGQLMEQLNTYLIEHEALTNKQKCEILSKLAECCFRLLEGGSEYLQIMDLGCTTILALAK